MIPYSTCLCFGGRRDARRWVILHDGLGPFPRRTAEITVDSSVQNAVFVRMSEDATLACAGTSPSLATPASQAGEPSAPESAAASRRLSETDRRLIESLDVGKRRPRHAGRFLTMHKRRRKRLTTRALNQEPGMLDDVLHGQVQCVLQKAGNWRFNAFTLETVTGGRSLPVLCVHLFHWYGLLQHFDLDVVRVWKLFALIEEGYHSVNPYHNSIHATDVTQAMHCFLQEEKIKRHLSPLEIMASLIGAVTHDLDHPGVNQPFLVATSNHLAALYENTSVLENHHWRSAIGCLLESGVSEQLPKEVRPELQRHISSLILATDITRQQEFLTRFKRYLDDNALDMRRSEDRHFVLQIALKCADISNPCRPWDISKKWSHKVCEEFFRQGDYERQLNLPVTPLCDRYTTSIPKIQAGFFKFVVTPLYDEWHRFLGDGLSVSLMEHLRSNQSCWEALIVQENAEESKTEMSELEEMEDVAMSSGDEGAAEDSGSIDLLLPKHPEEYAARLNRILPCRTGGVGRRHSVPMSIAKPFSLPQATAGRRESVPIEHRKLPRNPIRLEPDNNAGRSSLSLLSSSRKSSVHEGTSVSTSVCSTVDRPVSAENLLPEPSIASITSSVEASRLSTVLQPDQAKPGSTQSKQLTRQQTFPPLQPYVRTRYMSTTNEMSRFSTDQVLLEADSCSSSCSSSSPAREFCAGGGRCGTPPLSRSTPTPGGGPQFSRRRGSALSDAYGRSRSTALTTTSESCLRCPASSEYPRRHSVQVLSDLKQRHRRPSTQELNDSTQRFYASLTGASQNEGGKENAEEQRTLPDCPVKMEVNDNVATRRYSTPLADSRTTTVDTVASRRFSATIPPVTEQLPIQRVFFVGTPPDSPPPRLSSTSSSSDSTGAEPVRKSVSDKFAPDASVEPDMKENVDPRTSEEGGKLLSLPRRLSGQQGLTRRRGSAPVGLLSRLEDVSASSTAGRIDRYSRRGSVPTDITRHQNGGSHRSALGPRDENFPSPRRASLPSDAVSSNLLSERENCPSNNNNGSGHGGNGGSGHGGNGGSGSSANNNNNTSYLLRHHHSGSNNNGTARTFESALLPPGSGISSTRRGSVPADISELRRDLFSRNSVNGKSRNRKKILRRRSSGGPEMFAGSGTEGNDNGAWPRWKRDPSKRDSIPEPVIKRRGSLPIEMVAVSHTGSTSAPRRSSLWRL